MTIQYEKAKATLDILKLDIKLAVERLEEILDQITEREYKLQEEKNSKIKGVADARNSRPI